MIERVNNPMLYKRKQMLCYHDKMCETRIQVPELAYQFDLILLQHAIHNEMSKS